jgi:membrane associated rhomboid family serine protease/predicted negative regulator of RcsB-dependent stress response
MIAGERSVTMANCTSCGKQTRALTFGGATSLCPECQKKADAVAAPHSPDASPNPVARFSQLRHPVTSVLVGMNVAVFAAMVLTGSSALEPTSNQLIRWGADWGPLSLSTQPWRLLTSNYVHIGIIHIFFNMWCLWNLGALAERIFDRWTYVLIYTFCGIAGSCASLWWHPEVVGAGASGAIFGLAGAALAALYLGKFRAPKEAIRPTLKSLLSFAGWNLFLGLRLGVDNAAHLGGLISGLALGAVFAKTLMADEENRSSLRNLVALGSAALLLFAIFGLRREHTYAKNIPSPEEYSEAYDKAIDALKSSDYKSAIPELQKLVLVNPSAETHYLLGSAYLGAKQPDDALASFQQALRLKPNYADAEVGLGEAYAAKGMNSEAQEAYARAAAMRH